MIQLLYALVALSCSHLFAAEPLRSESTLQQVDLRLCEKTNRNCVSISAARGHISHFQNLISLELPLVHGLGFDSKEISSAVIDLSNGIILLRERKNRIYLGEWTINLDTLHRRFFPVPQ